MLRLILITATLLLYWLVLSGHYTPWLISMGVVSALAVVAFAYAKGIIDTEGFPIERLGSGLVYWPWLAWQIVLSALAVSRVVLDPRLPISPTMVRVPCRQKTAVGLTTYANSITLTPGTISVELSEGACAVWVHALTREGAEGMADDEMNRRVAAFEGRRA